MARHERDFPTPTGEPLSIDQVLALLATAETGGEEARADGIACALSASDGWQEAVKRLGGAFSGEEAGLRERKAKQTKD